ncbi:MAG: hypothetical protein KC442_15300 [Thermomicrobiales bacterium]|nr:hypothetical protein [Thermomicrobiales bacterium]
MARATKKKAVPAVDITVLEERRTSLRGRLDDGYRRIEEAEMAGVDVAEWEAFWFKLLHEYEDVCRELDQAA